MWSAPAKNMKKINMSISFVYDVSIQDNCENAVFTFLPFYKQKKSPFVEDISDSPHRTYSHIRSDENCKYIYPAINLYIFHPSATQIL